MGLTAAEVSFPLPSRGVHSTSSPQREGKHTQRFHEVRATIIQRNPISGQPREEEKSKGATLTGSKCHPQTQAWGRPAPESLGAAVLRANTLNGDSKAPVY